MSGRAPRPNSLVERPAPVARPRPPSAPAAPATSLPTAWCATPALAEQLEGDPVVARRDDDLEAACLERRLEGQQVLHLRRVVDVDPDRAAHVAGECTPSSSATRARPQYIQAVDQRM